MSANESWRDKDPGFFQTYVGHILTSIFTFGLPMFVLLALAKFVIESERATYAGVASATVLIVLIAELMGTALYRHFAKKQNHPTPASVWLTFQQIVGPAVSGFIVGGFVVTRGGWDCQWALISASIGTILGAFHAFFLDKSWKHGMSQEEMNEKWQETREMTREHFNIRNPRD